MRQDPEPLRLHVTLPDAIILGVGLSLGFLLVWSGMIIGLGLVAYAVLRTQL